MENKFAYDNILIKISKAFDTAMESIAANYNFDLGDEFEIALCKVLRKFLPLKYGIARGFVVSKNGKKAGDDIIIYDQEIFPTLRFLVKDDFSRKEEIPIEAVYVYIEAKHKLDKESFKKSFKQVRDGKNFVMNVLNFKTIMI